LETVTYAIANIMTHGHIYLTNTEAWCFDALTECFPQVKIHNTDFGFLAEGPVTQSVNLTTAPHPGMPTDLQAQMMVLATQIPGQSFITETIWENRMMHVPELCRMGADISVEHNDGANKATINGGLPLYGAPVMATDLRASVSLVLAGLCAKGQTTVSRIYHLDRGYHALDEKLNMCGADIVRSKQEAA
jgi:UDP-N-acetylglucosamine 1-carboxyvinyltransferase